MLEKITIITNPNKILRNISQDIDLGQINSPEIQELFPAMEKIMIKKDGVGLAAPQIGKNIRIIVVRSENKILKMINPVITKKSWARESGEEGCLSIPNVFGKVLRHKKIKCIYFDEKGKKISLEASGMLARVIQHETDHLDGILFIDKIQNEN